jgi:hypothetical protein
MGARPYGRPEMEESKQATPDKGDRRLSLTLSQVAGVLREIRLEELIDHGPAAMSTYPIPLKTVDSRPLFTESITDRD